MKILMIPFLAGCTVANAYALPPKWVEVGGNKDGSVMSVDTNRIKSSGNATWFWTKMDNVPGQRFTAAINHVAVECDNEEKVSTWNSTLLDANGQVISQDTNVSVADIVPGSMLNTAADFACALGKNRKPQK